MALMGAVLVLLSCSWHSYSQRATFPDVLFACIGVKGEGVGVDLMSASI